MGFRPMTCLTLSETVAMAAEAFEGTIPDLYLPRRR